MESLVLFLRICWWNLKVIINSHILIKLVLIRTIESNFFRRYRQTLMIFRTILIGRTVSRSEGLGLALRNKMSDKIDSHNCLIWSQIMLLLLLVIARRIRPEAEFFKISIIDKSSWRERNLKCLDCVAAEIESFSSRQIYHHYRHHNKQLCSRCWIGTD